LLIYASGALFLLLALFFFFKDYFDPVETVELTGVSYTSPSQASALLTASGYVVAQRKAAVASKATGRLVYLGFKEGDRVEKGQIIARIECADMEAALEQAKADREVAKADSVDAAQSLSRTKTLLANQLISQAEFDAAKAKYDRVIASIASRVAAVKSAAVQLENTNIRAPFDGTILTKNADIGEVVAPFGAGASSRVAVVTIADMSSLEVEADVSESNLERIRVQQPCEITLDAYPERRYRAVVDKIVPTADRAKATVMTKIKFVEIDSRVIPEMGAKVHFLAKQFDDSSASQPRLTVESSAVVTRNGRKVAFVLQDRNVVEREVTIGRDMGNSIELTSGLKAGDKVVLKPSERLRSGSKIQLKP